MPKGWKLGRSGVRLHNFTLLSISILDLRIKSFSLCLPVNTFVIISKIGTEKRPLFLSSLVHHGGVTVLIHNGRLDMRVLHMGSACAVQRNS